MIRHTHSHAAQQQQQASASQPAEDPSRNPAIEVEDVESPRRVNWRAIFPPCNRHNADVWGLYLCLFFITLLFLAQLTLVLSKKYKLKTEIVADPRVTSAIAQLAALRNSYPNQPTNTGPSLPTAQVITNPGQSNILQTPPTPTNVALVLPSNNRVSVAPTPVSAAPKLPVVYFCYCHSTDYQHGTTRGGAQGEIIVGNALLAALDTLNYKVFDGMRDGPSLTSYFNDERQKLIDAGKPVPDDFFPFTKVFIDPWTYPDAKQFIPARRVYRKDKLRVLDFFGTPPQRVVPQLAQEGITAREYLNPYPKLNEWNGFIGFSVQPNPYLNDPPRPTNAPPLPLPFVTSKKNQGVIWGKEPRYFDGYHQLLQKLVAIPDVQIHVVLAKEKNPPPLPNQIINHGHLKRDEWLHLLAESKFLLGLGDPVLGPSVMEAIASGMVYINPIYNAETPNPGKELFPGVWHYSQHDYAKSLGKPYVCNVGHRNEPEILDCVRFALTKELPAYVPNEFTEAAHVERVRKILEE